MGLSLAEAMLCGIGHLHPESSSGGSAATSGQADAEEPKPSGPGVIAEIVIPERAVPWKAPTVGRHGTFPNPALVRWKRTVAKAAEAVMRGKSPYLGLVYIQMWFYMTMPKNHSIPDWTNCAKSTEDALQGIVFKNDRQVVEAYVERKIGDENATIIKVVSA